MIIWLASYPKSGNTWIRSFIISLLSENGVSNIKKLNLISQYPLRSNFKNLTKNIDNVDEMKKNWIKSQEIINLDKKIKFLKTHHVLCTLRGDSFTNYKNSLGVIHIVRDPRSIVSSIKYHFSKKNNIEAKDFILDEKKIIGRNLDEIKNEYADNEILTLISSWKSHYNSWKTFNKNYLLIKYENLLSNNFDEFKKITNYLSAHLKIKIDEKKIHKAIISNSFENLKKQEEIHGFSERSKDKITGNNKKFFNLGPNNKWQNLLEKKIITEIEKKFNSEMKELDYL